MHRRFLEALCLEGADDVVHRRVSDVRPLVDSVSIVGVGLAWQRGLRAHSEEPGRSEPLDPLLDGVGVGEVSPHRPTEAAGCVGHDVASRRARQDREEILVELERLDELGVLHAAALRPDGVGLSHERVELVALHVGQWFALGDEPGEMEPDQERALVEEPRRVLRPADQLGLDLVGVRDAVEQCGHAGFPAGLDGLEALDQLGRPVFADGLGFGLPPQTASRPREGP